MHIAHTLVFALYRFCKNIIYCHALSEINKKMHILLNRIIINDMHSIFLYRAVIAKKEIFH